MAQTYGTMYAPPAVVLSLSGGQLIFRLSQSRNRARVWA
jgi:hypothetical protein